MSPGRTGGRWLGWQRGGCILPAGLRRSEPWDQLTGHSGDFWKSGCTPLTLGASDGNANAHGQRHFSWLKKQASSASLGQDGRTDRHRDGPCCPEQSGVSEAGEQQTSPSSGTAKEATAEASVGEAALSSLLHLPLRFFFFLFAFCLCFPCSLQHRGLIWREAASGGWGAPLGCAQSPPLPCSGTWGPGDTRVAATRWGKGISQQEERGLELWELGEIRQPPGSMWPNEFP